MVKYLSIFCPSLFQTERIICIRNDSHLLSSSGSFFPKRRLRSRKHWPQVHWSVWPSRRPGREREVYRPSVRPPAEGGTLTACTDSINLFQTSSGSASCLIAPQQLQPSPPMRCQTAESREQTVKRRRRISLDGSNGNSHHIKTFCQ